jgi:hypothetical protein
MAKMKESSRIKRHSLAFSLVVVVVFFSPARR